MLERTAAGPGAANAAAVVGAGIELPEPILVENGAEDTMAPALAPSDALHLALTTGLALATATSAPAPPTAWPAPSAASVAPPQITLPDGATAGIVPGTAIPKPPVAVPNGAPGGVVSGVAPLPAAHTADAHRTPSSTLFPVTRTHVSADRAEIGAALPALASSASSGARLPSQLPNDAPPATEPVRGAAAQAHTEATGGATAPAEPPRDTAVPNSAPPTPSADWLDARFGQPVNSPAQTAPSSGLVHAPGMSTERPPSLPSPGLPSPSSADPAPLRSDVVSVVHDGGVATLTVRLGPDDSGPVQVKIEGSEQSGMAIEIRAVEPAILAALQRDQDQLGRLLEAQGFSSQSRSLTFAFDDRSDHRGGSGPWSAGQSGIDDLAPPSGRPSAMIGLIDILA